MNQFAFFPSRTMALYMVKGFLTRSLAVLAMLVIILMSLDLLRQTSDILAPPGNGSAEIMTYIGWRTPQVVAQFLPFSVLLGTLIMLATLNQNSEIVSMKAAGLSAHQILAPLVLAACGIAALTLLFNETVLAPTSAKLSAWQAVDYGEIPRDSDIRSNVWLLDGDDLIHAELVIGSGPSMILKNVRVNDRSNGGLSAVIQGKTARWIDNGWTLDDATTFSVASATTTPPSTVRFGLGVQPTSFTISSLDPDALGFSELRSAIADQRAAGRPTAGAEAAMWHKLSGPLASILMPLLGSIAGFGLARAGKTFIRVVIGMALGFTYFVADNFSLAMGNLGAYDPFVAAWAPFFLFLLLGETVLIRSEE